VNGEANVCVCMTLPSKYKILMLVFWVVMPCRHVGRYQLKMEAVCSLKTLESVYKYT
jgi:hypothetical protein